MERKSNPPPPSARALDAARRAAPREAQSAAALHEQVTGQVRELLQNSDLGEEEKQQILTALSCPCCGAGGLSLSLKLSRPGAF